MDKTSGEKPGADGILAQAAQSLRRGGAGIGLAAACFFMGRAQIYGGISPLVIAGAATAFLEGKRFYIYALATLAGLVTRFSVEHSIKYFIAIGIMWFINICFNDKAKKIDLLAKCAAAGIIMLLSGLATAVIRGLDPYGLMICVLEGVLAFSLSFILAKGREALVQTYAARKESLNSEELVCAMFFAGGVVMGAADIWVGWISLRYMLCGFLTLLVLRAAGSAAIAAGLVLGVLMNAAGYEGHGFALVLAVSALLCGFIKNDHKAAQAGAFTGIAAVLSLYFGLFSIPLVISLVLASLLFFFLNTHRLLAGAREMMTPAGISAGEYYSRVGAMASARLQGAAASFSKLAKTFGGLSKPRTGLTMPEVRSLLDDVIAKSCAECVKSYVCWEQDFYDTYQKAFEALKNCDVLPVAEVESHPIMDFCIRRTEFYGNIRHFFELYRNDLKWRNYLSESRYMAQVQLTAAAGVIGELAGGLNFGGRFDWELERKLRQAFIKKGIPVLNIIVVVDKEGRYEAEITHKSCGSNHKCAEYALIAAETLGRKMRKRERECAVTAVSRAEGKRDGMEKDACRLRLVEESPLKAACGAACSAVSTTGESGDSYSHMENRNGRVTLILSDGMGKGKAAGISSRATVELFEDFMEAGFDKNVAARLINSALLLKSIEGNENYSTLDVCSIDTYAGRAEFLKVGASSTFIVSGEGGAKEVEAIMSYNLPVGILESVEPEIASRRVKHGDIIIMMTDGVLDSVVGMEQKEGWVVAAMKKLTSTNPQHIADHLLACAQKNSAGAVRDDMTVLVARIWERG
ncbi:MAG: SpoIIE family protein phosphatase [Defluviitaleaceae bacterium]|nr:SpoIIE family protein phosphatase [Defluviitaleaceae bacterium]MCL2836157.1 SpoIIE family protein phosphatase [Defluviitaleaceae bacterium]